MVYLVKVRGLRPAFPARRGNMIHGDSDTEGEKERERERGRERQRQRDRARQRHCLWKVNFTTFVEGKFVTSGKSKICNSL